jgi:phosphoribosylamine--glycine ligase/phosphoribosylformylglycinamidine cyclo-ligase
MRVLVIGSGGREHALAWRLAQSPQIERLYVAPGNAGTAELGSNVPIAVTDIPALVEFARAERVDLTVVGPEAPLAAGLVDAFTAAGLVAFGPTRAAAQLEASKAFAKRFMIEEGIPTAPAVIFGDYEAAHAYVRHVGVPIVVKASGLAAGKGVFVCDSLGEAEAALRAIMIERVFGSAGDEVIIETCLHGEEVSLLALCDGRTALPLIPARDYKRVGDGDTGPNTGGMGGYAPSPHLSPPLIREIETRVLQPTLAGMRRRGTPYSGVLYAGLMLTDTGPRVLEFNCRFGDPETQSLLPLLDTDLAEVLLACSEGRLHRVTLRWKPEYAVCVVLAAGGYPGEYATGVPISIETGIPAVIFHAGTRLREGRPVTAGGRVLAVTATAPTLAAARDRAYAAVQCIHFEGMHYRTDIAVGAAPDAGAPVTAPESPIQVADILPDGAAAEPGGAADAYAASGVNIEAGQRAVEMMQAAVTATYTDAVLRGHGAFGGLLGLREALTARDPVLVASTDGVGTKTLIAAAMQRYDTIGHDIVNHCVNDILVQGARPLFFLDYIAAAHLEPASVAAIVGGCAAACRAAGCVLLGGETAEMPGVYQAGAFDLVGTIVGWVERDAIADPLKVRPGDVCVGLPSSGLHTNGYSLARRVLGDLGWETVLPDLGMALGDALLTPHRSYLREVERLWQAGIRPAAMAHITGGGFVDNIPRALPPGLGVRLDRSSWSVPPLFRTIQVRGGVTEAEMYRVFNMGIGLVLILSPDDACGARDVLPEAIPIGTTVAWDGQGPRVEWVGDTR